MGIYLHHIFSGVGVGGFHEGEENFIYPRTASGIHQVPQDQAMTLEGLYRSFGLEHLLGYF